MFLLYLAVVLCCGVVLSQEAVITADSVASQTNKSQGSTDAVIVLDGNVSIVGEDFKLLTQKAIMHKNTRDFDIPNSSKIEYTGTNEKITIYSSKLFTNLAKKTFFGNDVVFISNVVSYKSNNIDVKNGVALFASVKFSTCKMFNEDDQSECGMPWYGKASTLNYDYRKKKLKARNFVMYVHGVPIFYTPYIRLTLDKNKNGFQKFKLLNTNSQQGITFSYVIDDSKYGEFTFVPEIYFNQNKSNPIISRANNIQVIHEYSNPSSFKSYTDVKVAPEAYIPNNNGAATSNRDMRYYIMTGNEYGKNNYSFTSGIQATSDRFFRRLYNNTPLKPTENYFVSHVNYFNFNQEDQSYGFATKHYVPMTANNQNTIPALISSARYNKELSATDSDYMLSSNSEILNFQRQIGISGTRLKTALNASKDLIYKGFRFQASTSLNVYNYSYRGSDLQPEYSNAQRLVGDTSITASRLFLYSYKDYITQIKPILFMDYTNSLTRNGIINEDSSTTFVTDTNVMLSSKFSGYDLVDKGLKIAYGLDIKARDLGNKKNVNLFFAQRYSTSDLFSDYVARTNIMWHGYNFTSRLIFNKDNANIKYSNTNIMLPVFKFLDFGFGYFFIDKSFSNTVVDTQNYRYSVKLKYNSHFIFTDILQNPKFLTANNKTQNIISGISGGIGYESKCLFYRLGLQRQATFTGVQIIMNNVYIIEFRVAM